jgi:phosphatidylglycerophosphate synthase
LAQVRATFKRRDAWWTVLLVDPLAGRLVRIAAGVGWVTPTRLTVTAFLLGLGAAGAFLAGTPGWLIAGALIYHLGFVIDCMDGKLARLRGTESILGSWLDFVLDRVRVVLCLGALFGGQFQQTGEPLFLGFAIGAVFLALFGYLNGAETGKALARMAGLAATDLPDPAPPGGLGRVRAALHRHRIRVNLVSGVEFEMFLLVVAPLAAAFWRPEGLLWVAAGAAVLLVGFELALMARFWITARSFDRRAANRTPLPVPAQRTGPAAPAGQRAHYSA